MTETASSEGPQFAPIVVGRYLLHAPVARGGMATIHVARLLGAEGFSRIVAAKRLHPQFTEAGEFLAMFLDEARIASKIHHPNVVPVLDVVVSEAEVILVQEYVHGVPLDKLLILSRQKKLPIAIPIVVAIGIGVLQGLEAAHETKDEVGVPLNVVHRDVSPQNVMVSIEGTPRLLDFGVAKASLSTHVTRAGVMKGKIAYMAPEQLKGEVSKATDLYAMGIVLWEALTGRRLHAGKSEAELFSTLLQGSIDPITKVVDKEAMEAERWEQLQALEPIITKAMALEPADRYASAGEMAEALAAAIKPASPKEVAAWVKSIGQDFLEGREKVLASEEASWRRRKAAGEDAAEGSNPAASSREVSAVKSKKPPAGIGAEDSKATATEEGGRERSRGILLVAVLICLLLAAILVVLLRKQDPGVAAVPTGKPELAAPPTGEPTPTQAPTAIAAQPVAPTATATAAPTAAPPSVPVNHGRYHPPSAPPAVTTTPPVAAPPPPPQTTPPPAAENCNPPFYFEGKKKIFKPGCI